MVVFISEDRVTFFHPRRIRQAFKNEALACGLLACALIFGVASIGASASPAPLYDVSSHALDHVNEARIANGLPSLHIQKQLMDAAQNHTFYMANSQNFSHSEDSSHPLFTGESHAERTAFTDYAAVSVTENLNKSSRTSWKESAELLMAAIYHRKSFLHLKPTK